MITFIFMCLSFFLIMLSVEFDKLPVVDEVKEYKSVWETKMVAYVKLMNWEVRLDALQTTQILFEWGALALATIGFIIWLVIS